MPKLLNLIVACSENRVIGRNGKLPWHIPEDAKFLHEMTAGNVCVLGRVCYDTWPAVHRDGRRPVVLTNHPLGASIDPADATTPRVEHPAIVVPTFPKAIAAADSLPGDIYLCGGQRVYEEGLALPRPMRLYLTLVHTEVPGDTFFPEWRHLSWHEISRRESGDGNYRYTFFTLERG